MDDKIEQMVIERAGLIDSELRKFLEANNIPFQSQPKELRDFLIRKGLELIHQTYEMPTETVHVFKICKVLNEKRFSIK